MPAPTDPKAPPSHRDGWPTTPQSRPPYPFTEWPYGGATSIGVSRPNSVDSPLMVALANTALGKAMSDAHIQVYGWINPGANLSTSTVQPGGNFRRRTCTRRTRRRSIRPSCNGAVSDTVQTELHIDWGFRVSGIYGENYRYTTAYGIASYQLFGHNLVNGYDFPMIYGELYLPQFAQGLVLRAGRFIAIHPRQRLQFQCAVLRPVQSFASDLHGAVICRAVLSELQILAPG